MAVVHVYLVRHGETAENRQGIIQGHMDTHLNAIGEEQATLVADALKLVPFDIAYSSDLSRAAKTAETILIHHPDVKLQKQRGLRERDMGNLQGNPLSEGVRAAILGDDTVEHGEIVKARTIAWWNKSILQRAASLPPKGTPYRILVVSHGGFIGTLVHGLINSRKAECAEGVVLGPCYNTSVSVIETEGRKGTIVMYGNISHLGEEQVMETNADEVRV